MNQIFLLFISAERRLLSFRADESIRLTPLVREEAGWTEEYVRLGIRFHFGTVGINV